MARHYHPKGILLSCLPESIVPYAELIRIHKPVGILNIFLPYLFGALFTACTHSTTIAPWTLFTTTLSIFVFAFLLRSAGCTWNDIADRDLDRLVERTRSRPMARGAISIKAAYIFTAAQVMTLLALFRRLLPDPWVSYAAPLILLVWFYPFAKRFTNYAQVVLGITLGWGVLVGGAIMGVDVQQMGMGNAQTQGLAELYALYATWTVIHDIVYAHQDVKDDMKAGIGSMAVRWRRWTKTVLSGLGIVQIGLLWDLGARMDAGSVYFCTALGGNVVILICLILRLDLSNPQSCLWWFQMGSLAFGVSIATGLLGEYIARV